MANTTSAKKATRKIAAAPLSTSPVDPRCARGSHRREAIKSGDLEAALKAMTRAEPELMQAAQRNIIHKNNAAERSRGSRIRSQSSRNELINENIRQASPALPGFLFFVGFGTAGLGLRSSDRTRISTVVCPLYARNGLTKPAMTATIFCRLLIAQFLK